MTEEITYNYFTKTQDSNDPVVKAKLKDSSMTFILDSTHDSINVWHVDSREKGDMKKILDDLVSQIPTNKVNFLFPFTEEEKEKGNEVYEEYNIPSGFDEGENIRDVLNDYEEKIVNWDGQEVHLLECIWHPDG